MKNQDGYYEIKVIEQEFIPNRKEAKRVKITVKTDVNGENVKEQFTFTPDQVFDGRWEKHVVTWVEKQETEKEIPDLTGEKIKNTGYDYTGPDRKYDKKKRKKQKNKKNESHN